MGKQKMDLKSASLNLRLRRSARIYRKGVKTYQETDTCSEESYRKEGNILSVAKMPNSPCHEQNKRKNTYYSRERKGRSSKFSKKLDNDNSNQHDQHFQVASVEPSYTLKGRSNVNISDPIWRGSFSIYDKVFLKVDGLIAYKSSKACGEGLDIVGGSLPASLLSKVLSKLNVWPKIFNTSIPTDDVVDLYIFPENDSGDKAFNTLVDYLSEEELCLKTMLDETKILVFSSRQLPHQYWRTLDKYYLWAVFIGKNSSFPYEEEDSKSTHSIGLVVPPKSAEDVDAAAGDEGQCSNGAHQDYSEELSDRRSSERLHTIEKSNHAEPFTSSTQITGQGNIQMASFPNIQRSKPVMNSAFQAHKGKETSQLTIGTSILNMARHFDNDDDDDTFDEIDSGDRVGRYLVKSSVAPILRAIINKHGDIAEESSLQSSATLSFMLERICEVVQEFQGLNLKNLKQQNMKFMQSVIVDAESVKVNVKWLRSLHDELMEVVKYSKEYRNQKQIRRDKMKVIDSNKSTVELKRSEVARLQDEIESLLREIETLTAETESESPNADPPNAESYKRFKHCSSLMDGLL